MESSPNAAAVQPAVSLASPRAARNWDEFRRQAAQRMVAANPNITYTGPVPEPLLAIPVLEVELDSDGSVRKVEVVREPRQAKDTIQIAIDAVRRAAPYGDMRNLKKPWKFSEVFLFDDERRFKPRTLDE
jgi:protein TonB